MCFSFHLYIRIQFTWESITAHRLLIFQQRSLLVLIILYRHSMVFFADDPDLSLTEVNELYQYLHL